MIIPRFLEQSPCYSWPEQKLQDAYCRAHGLPLMKQRRTGIDYHYGPFWLEFTREGIIERKDYEQYPQEATDGVYLIIFADGIFPGNSAQQKMVEFQVRYQVWHPSEPPGAISGVS